MPAAGMKSFVFLACLALLLSCRSTINAARTRQDMAELDENLRPSAAAFFQSPKMSHLALSPNGKLLAGILEREGVEVVFVLVESIDGFPGSLKAPARHGRGPCAFPTLALPVRCRRPARARSPRASLRWSR